MSIGVPKLPLVLNSGEHCQFVQSGMVIDTLVVYLTGVQFRYFDSEMQTDLAFVPTNPVELKLDGVSYYFRSDRAYELINIDAQGYMWTNLCDASFCYAPGVFSALERDYGHLCPRDTDFDKVNEFVSDNLGFNHEFTKQTLLFEKGSFMFYETR
jgi:hypothetical protein